MRANDICRIITTCIFLSSPVQAFCVPPVSYLGIEQGLSNNSVTCIYQDHKGFMWFGTYDGLNRYDGYGFKVFRNKFGDTNSLVSNFISVIAEDKNNKIWLGTRKGISVYNGLNGKFSSIFYFSGEDGKEHRLADVVKDIKRDRNNNMLIATEIAGLLFCPNASFTAKQVLLQEEEGGVIYQYGVQFIHVDDAGRTWVFVQGKGLYQLDYNKMILRQVNTLLKSANCFVLDGDSIWMGTNSGVYNYNIRRNTCKKVFGTNEIPLNSDFVKTIAMDKEKNLWIGTNGGGVNIWNIPVKKMSNLLPGEGKNALSSGAVNIIYVDKQSRKWIGTQGGINIIDPQKERFRTVAHEPGNANSLSGDFISAFYESPDRTLWVGTEWNGLNFLYGNKNSFLLPGKDMANLTNLTINNVTCIEGDKEHNIWVSTFTAGIYRLNTTKGIVEHYIPLNARTGIENKIVYRIYEDRFGVLWATSLREGNVFGALYRFDMASNRFEMFDDNLSDLFVLNEDKSGNLWGGNLTQLVKIDRDSKKHSYYNIGLPVRAIEADRAGNLWIGTEGGGLVLFDREQNRIAARFTTGEGLCNNSIISMLEDGNGDLWMGTFNGLSRFNVEERSFKNYYRSDGLQSNQFNYNTAIRLRSGDFAFGGMKGLSIFSPTDLGKGSMASPLLFTDLLIDGIPVEKDISVIGKTDSNEVRELIVPYNKAAFSFGFSALEYSSPANISYAYYLEGWDKKWNYTGDIRNAAYTHLPEGHYTFRVKSTNTEGIWNPHELILKIIVLPPWYRAWWAWVLYGGAVIALVCYYILYKNRQARLQYEVRLAHLETDKEREINEKKLSFFTNISHEFRTPLTLIINPIKEMMQNKAASKKAGEDDLGTVYRNARRMLSLVDQLLLFRKTESGTGKMRVTKLNFHNLCHEVFLCFVQQANAKNIEYHFSNSNESLELYADREKMEIILYNLVSNALKYTPVNGKVNGKIDMSINEGEKWVEVLVKDNGPGIPGDIGENLFAKFYQADTKNTLKKNGFGIGLYLVKHFAGEHKGEISYESELGTGTIFSLRLQKGNAHFDPAMIMDNFSATSVYLQEIAQEESLEQTPDQQPVEESQPAELVELITEKQSILVVDDESEIRMYVAKIFKDNYTVYEGTNGNEGLKLARQYQPDIIISDIKMQGLNGIDLCKAIKEDPSLNHIPVILLTGSSSAELKLEGVEGGADDYITKPFEKELLVARVAGLMKNRSNLQRYFYNEITLNHGNLKISADYKEFLEKCIIIVEKHLENQDFTIKTLAAEIGISHSVVYKKIKAISGQSINGFIRFIRLRKAARLFIDTTCNVNEVATMVGIYDAKYFREHFNKVFGLNPSDYIKKYRKPFAGKFSVNKEGMHGIEPSENPEPLN